MIGAQRSGSTYLFGNLDGHPEIFMAKPLRPEPKYFLDSARYGRGKTYYEEAYFKKRRQRHKYIGEKSTSYLEFPQAGRRIHSYYPHARILIILRNPITRAYSNYQFSVMNKIENLSFGEALDAEKGRLLRKEYQTSVNPYAYLKRGHYIDYLRSYVEIFGRSQIKIVIAEEYLLNLSAIAELYEWLGVNSKIIPNGYDQKVNSSDVSLRDDPDWHSIYARLQDSYAASISTLEAFLGRQIDVWKEPLPDTMVKRG